MSSQRFGGTMFEDIAGFKKWQKIEKIDYGWSSDIKYYIETIEMKKYALRISDIKNYQEKKKEYEVITKFAQLGFDMSLPVDFGVCNEGQNVFMLLVWVEGEELETALRTLKVDEQYKLGREAGAILKKIHSIKVQPNDLPKNTKISKKIAQLESYKQSFVRVANDEIALEYLSNHIHKIWSKPPVYLHGDFHPGNLILQPNGKIGVIDFNRWEIGDPYEEFYKLESFGTSVSIPYCVGQIDAYFDDYIPSEFWEILSVYVAHASLYSIKWAEKFGQKDIDHMTAICMKSFEHFDNFKACIPTWYYKHRDIDFLTGPL